MNSTIFFCPNVSTLTYKSMLESLVGKAKTIHRQNLGPMGSKRGLGSNHRPTDWMISKADPESKVEAIGKGSWRFGQRKETKNSIQRKQITSPHQPKNQALTHGVNSLASLTPLTLRHKPPFIEDQLIRHSCADRVQLQGLSLHLMMECVQLIN